MIPTSALFDQSTLMCLLTYEAAVQRCRRLFAHFDWSLVLPHVANRA